MGLAFCVFYNTFPFRSRFRDRQADPVFDHACRRVDNFLVRLVRFGSAIRTRFERSLEKEKLDALGTKTFLELLVTSVEAGIQCRGAVPFFTLLKA